MSKRIRNKQWWDRHSKKLQKKKYHHSKKSGSTHSFSPNESMERSAPQFHVTQHESIKTVPNIFSFLSNPGETIDFFDDIIREIREKRYKNSFTIDSSQTQYVSADALIYMIAIMRNIKINYEMKYSFRGNLPQNDEAAAIYQESGFMSYVESKQTTLPACTDKMQITSGIRNESNMSADFCRFVMDKLHKSRKEIQALHKVLVELMSNVYHHAYNNNDLMHKCWYLYAEHVDDCVHFVFVDTGAGIARTVRKNFLEKMMRITKVNYSDSDLIYSALMGDFRTETNKSHRSNGLPGVREWAETDLFRNFTVLSGSGQCTLSHDNILIKNEHKNKIYGTIYMFDIV